VDQKQKIDILESQVDRIQHLIERADTKASILLAFLGVVLTISINNGSFIHFLTTVFLQRSNRPSLLLLILVSLTFFSFLASFIFVVLTLRARLLLDQTGLTQSDFFYGKISKFEKFDVFQEAFQASLLDSESHYLKEILINSKICDLKYKYFNYSLLSLIIGIMFLLCTSISILL